LQLREHQGELTVNATSSGAITFEKSEGTDRGKVQFDLPEGRGWTKLVISDCIVCGVDDWLKSFTRFSLRPFLTFRFDRGRIRLLVGSASVPPRFSPRLPSFVLFCRFALGSSLISKSTDIEVSVAELDASLRDAPSTTMPKESTLEGTSKSSPRVASSTSTKSKLEFREKAKLYDSNFFIALLSQTSFVIANTLLAHYARWIEFLGGNLQQVGWVMGIGAASGLVLRPFLAQCINRLGAKTTWGLGYVIFAIAAAANYFLVEIHVTLFVLRALTILGTALVFASGLTYISQVAPESRRTEAIGTLGCGGFLGMLVGPVLGDFFLHSEVRTRPEFLTLFFVAAAANLVPLILLCFLRSPDPNHLKKQPTQNQSWDSGQFFKTIIQYWPGRIVYVDFVFGRLHDSAIRLLGELR
jgi:hypothetical protein